MTSATKSELPRREDSVEDIWRSFAEIRIYKTVINSDRSYLSTVWPDFRPFLYCPLPYCTHEFESLNWLVNADFRHSHGFAAFYSCAGPTEYAPRYNFLLRCGSTWLDWTTGHTEKNLHEPTVAESSKFQPPVPFLSNHLRHRYHH